MKMISVGQTTIARQWEMDAASALESDYYSEATDH